MRTIAEDMKEAVDVLIRKDKDYGNAKEVGGRIFELLFPDGITMKTAQEFNEHSTLIHIISKLVRYCNLRRGGERVNFESINDTLLDLGNYAFMLKNMVGASAKENP